MFRCSFDLSERMDGSTARGNGINYWPLWRVMTWGDVGRRGENGYVCMYVCCEWDEVLGGRSGLRIVIITFTGQRIRYCLRSL